MPVRRLVHSALAQRRTSVIDSGPAPIQCRANKTVCRENMWGKIMEACPDKYNSYQYYIHLYKYSKCYFLYILQNRVGYEL